MSRTYTEILREVNDLDISRYLVRRRASLSPLGEMEGAMLLEERLTLAMAEAEEYDIDLRERHLAGEAEIGIAQQAFVYVAYAIACIRLTVGKDDLYLGVIDKQSNKFAASITGGS